MSQASRFAAAFSLSAKADNDKETDDDKKARRAKAREKKAEESDEDYAKRCEQLDKDEKAEDDKEKKDAAAPAEEKPESAKPEDENCATARREGIAAERKRWEMTLCDPRAANRGLAACTMLAGTDMTASQIGATLQALPEQAPVAAARTGGGLAERMREERVDAPAPGPGGAGPVAGSAAHTASLIVAAANKVRGDKSAA